MRINCIPETEKTFIWNNTHSKLSYFFQLFLSVGVQSFICSYEHKQNNSIKKIQNSKFLLNQTTLYVYCEILLLLFFCYYYYYDGEKQLCCLLPQTKANIFQSSNIFSTATFFACWCCCMLGKLFCGGFVAGCLLACFCLCWWKKFMTRNKRKTYIIMFLICTYIQGFTDDTKWDFSLHQWKLILIISRNCQFCNFIVWSFNKQTHKKCSLNCQKNNPCTYVLVHILLFFEKYIIHIVVSS